MGEGKKQYNAWLEWELTQRAIAGNCEAMDVWEMEELCGINHRTTERHTRKASERVKRRGMIQSSDAK